MTKKAIEFTPEVMISAPRRSAGVPNYNGSLVLFSVSQYDFDDHKHTSKIQVLDTTKQETITVTTDEKSSNPIWFDDTSIALLCSTADGKTQLKIGGWKNFEESAYTAGVVDAPASNLKIVNIGEGHYGVALSAAANPDGSLYNSETADPKLTSGRLYSSLYVRHWDKWIERDRQSIWYGALLKEEHGQYQLSRITNALSGTGLESPIPPDGGTDHFDISAAGLIFIAKDPNLDPAINTKCNFYYVKLTDFRDTSPDICTLNISGVDGAMSSPVLSRDGKRAAFLAMKENGYESDKNYIFTIGNISESREVSALFMESSSGSEAWDRSPSQVAWSDDGETLFIVAEQEGRKRLWFSTEEDRRQHKPPTLLTHSGSVGDIKPISGRQVFVTATSFIDNSLYSIESLDRSASSQTISSQSRLFNLHEDQIDSFWFDASDAKLTRDGKAHAWVVRPSYFDHKKKYPLAFLVHGGPQGAWANEWSTRWNAAVFAEQGYIAVLPNPTGSTGYGQAFCDAIKEDWGGRPYQDLVSCFNEIKRRSKSDWSYIDTDRSVVLGASYGGFMVNWIQGHPLGREFKAIVCHDGVFNTQFQTASEELYFPYRDFGATWSENRDKYTRWSPAEHTEHWKTPQLIIHNEKDFRLTVSDGLAAFNVLQTQGVESQLLSFPEENHFVLKPENSLVWHETVLNFINKHVDLPLYRPHDTKEVVQDPPRDQSRKIRVIDVKVA